MRSKLIGLALLAGMSAELASAQPVIQAVPERPRIIVEGFGEAKMSPDIAIITYTVRGEGPTSDDSVRSMTAQGTEIEAALRRIDDAAEPLTGEVMVVPARSDECDESNYGSPRLSTGPCAILGYVATQSVTVRTMAVKDAGTMVGLASRSGAFEAQISDFDLRDTQTAQLRAINSALSDATKKATAIAEASHAKLGTILNISTNLQRSGEMIIVTAQKRSTFPAAPEIRSPVPVNVNPELITTKAQVTVTYAIGQ